MTNPTTPSHRWSRPSERKGMARAALALVLASLSTPLFAQDTDEDSPVTPIAGDWYCADRAEDIFQVSLGFGGLTVNNIAIVPYEPFMPALQHIRLSASATNFSATNRAVAVEAVGIVGEIEAPEAIAFALSASASFGMVSSGASETITSNVISSANTFDYDHICVRVTVG
ncbi:hypothetical protein, partial [Pelagibacterium montanilacus]